MLTIKKIKETDKEDIGQQRLSKGSEDKKKKQLEELKSTESETVMSKQALSQNRR